VTIDFIGVGIISLLTMSFLENDEYSDEGEDKNSIYTPIVNPELLSKNIFEKYRDFATSASHRIRELPLLDERTFGEYISGTSLGWNQEIQLTSKFVAEKRGILDIVTPNTMYQKIVAAIMVLISEIDGITEQAETKIYEALLIFGEEREFLPHEVVVENKEYYVTKLVGVLNDIHETIKNLNVLLKNMISQQHNLYSKHLKEYQTIFKKVLLIETFDSIGSIIVLVVSKV
jgi:hypothetical protein